MKRGGPLKRNPDKDREWRARSSPLRRARSALRRTGPRPKAPPPRPPEGPLDPEEWKAQVWLRAKKRCAVTGTWLPLRTFNTTHHPVSKNALRHRGLHHLVWDPRNGVLVAPLIHERHENGFERIPLEALPSCVWEFCRELDGLDGTEWATEHVKRRHPTMSPQNPQSSPTQPGVGG